MRGSGKGGSALPAWRPAVVAAARLVALAPPAGPRPADSAPPGPSAAEVTLCWGLLGAGVAAVLAAYNWRGGDPDRPPSAPPLDLVSGENMLVAGLGGVAVSVWQRKRVGDKRRRARLRLTPGGVQISW